MIDVTDLHALADNELTPQRREEVLAQLAADPRAEAEYQSILAMKSLLQTKTEQPDVHDVWHQCRGRLDELDKTRRVEHFVGKYAWGLCGAFFLAIMVGGVFNRATPRSVNPNDVSGYVSSLAPVSVPRTQNQAELNGSLRDVLGQAFKGRPSRMVVTAVGQEGTPGARTSYVQLSDEFGSVGVVALHDVSKVDGLWVYDADPKYRYTKVNNLPALFWTREDGVICMVVGQRSYEELHTLVQSMCKSR